MTTRKSTAITLIAAMCVAMGCFPGSGSPTGLATASGGGAGGVSSSRLAFLLQPNNVAAGSPISPEVKVIAVDSLGTVLPGFNGTVSVALGPGAGGAGGTLSGTLSIGATGGLAIFTTLVVDQPGQYTLMASAPGLVSVSSAPFTVFAR